MDTKTKDAFHKADELMDAVEKLMELWVVANVPLEGLNIEDSADIARQFYDENASMIESKIYGICKDKPDVMDAVILKNLMLSYVMDDVRKLIAESCEILFEED